MTRIESVTVLPNGVTSISIAGVEMPIILRPWQTLRYIKVSVNKSRFQIDDGKKTFVFMEWEELPG